MQKSQCRVLNAEESASELSLDLHARVAGKPTQSRATSGGSPTTFISARSRYSFRTARLASHFGTPPDDPNLATCHEKKSFFLHCRVPTAARMTTASFLNLSLGAAELAARPVLCADPPTHDCCNSRFRTPGDDHYVIGPAVFFSAIVGCNALTPCLCGYSRAMPQDARA